MTSFFQSAAIISFSQEEISSIWLSVKVAIICSVISIPIALAIGWWLARGTFRGKSFVEGILHLPLVMLPVATGYILLIVLGTNGFIGKWFYQWWGIRIAFDLPAVIIASITVSLPLFTRSVRTAIEMVDPRLEAAAKTLGTSSIITFFRITVPLALPGILSGLILSFARCLGEFGATITFAGNIEGTTRTIPLAVYSYMQVPGKEGQTLRLVIISAIISLVAMIASEYLNRRIIKKR